MKILLVHNDYGTHSGEEIVVDQMVQIYRALGYTVGEYRKSTAAIQSNLMGKIEAFVKGVFPQLCCGEFSSALSTFSPDIVHIHNLYPFIGAAVLKECKRRSIKVIMTVHNYRLICPTGLFMRECKPCEVCLHRGDELGCVWYNCEHSYPKSIGYALRNFIARKGRYYLDNIDLYCCLTEFQRQQLIAAGFDSSKILVVPNSASRAPAASNVRGDYVGYCGRLSCEKGVDMIIDVARSNPQIEFRFAGSTRDGYAVEGIPPNCKILGHLRGEEFANFIDGARFFVMASRCYEGFPMAILDAASYGKCTISPAHGGFVEIIENRGELIGDTFTPNVIDDLEEKILALWGDQQRIDLYSKNGIEAITKYYSPDVIRERWRVVVQMLYVN